MGGRAARAPPIAPPKTKRRPPTDAPPFFPLRSLDASGSSLTPDAVLTLTRGSTDAGLVRGGVAGLKAARAGLGAGFPRALALAPALLASVAWLDVSHNEGLAWGQGAGWSRFALGHAAALARLDARATGASAADVAALLDAVTAPPHAGARLQELAVGPVPRADGGRGWGAGLATALAAAAAALPALRRLTVVGMTPDEEAALAASLDAGVEAAGEEGGGTLFSLRRAAPAPDPPTWPGDTVLPPTPVAPPLAPVFAAARPVAEPAAAWAAALTGAPSAAPAADRPRVPLPTGVRLRAVATSAALPAARAPRQAPAAARPSSKRPRSAPARDEGGEALHEAHAIDLGSQDSDGGGRESDGGSAGARVRAGVDAARALAARLAAEDDAAWPPASRRRVVAEAEEAAAPWARPRSAAAAGRPRPRPRAAAAAASDGDDSPTAPLRRPHPRIASEPPASTQGDSPGSDDAAPTPDPAADAAFLLDDGADEDELRRGADENDPGLGGRRTRKRGAADDDDGPAALAAWAGDAVAHLHPAGSFFAAPTGPRRPPRAGAEPAAGGGGAVGAALAALRARRAGGVPQQPPAAVRVTPLPPTRSVAPTAAAYADDVDSPALAPRCAPALGRPGSALLSSPSASASQPDSGGTQPSQGGGVAVAFVAAPSPLAPRLPRARSPPPPLAAIPRELQAWSWDKRLAQHPPNSAAVPARVEGPRARRPPPRLLPSPSPPPKARAASARIADDRGQPPAKQRRATDGGGPIEAKGGGAGSNSDDEPLVALVARARALTVGTLPALLPDAQSAPEAQAPPARGTGTPRRLPAPAGSPPPPRPRSAVIPESDDE